MFPKTIEAMAKIQYHELCLHSEGQKHERIKDRGSTGDKNLRRR